MFSNHLSDRRAAAIAAGTLDEIKKGDIFGHQSGSSVLVANIDEIGDEWNIKELGCFGALLFTIFNSPCDRVRTTQTTWGVGSLFWRLCLSPNDQPHDVEDFVA